jgi:MinD superfamily P-loop ATPase
LKPQLKESSAVKVLVPEVDKNKCNGCGDCAKACQFHAITVVKQKVLVFPEICHHCGACIIFCQQKAMSEIERSIGIVEKKRCLMGCCSRSFYCRYIRNSINKET